MKILCNIIQFRNKVVVNRIKYLSSHNLCTKTSSLPEKLIDFVGPWPSSEKDIFTSDMRVVKDFINGEEETSLLQEIEPYLKRLRYEFDHWDDAIHGFRETERKHWYPDNKKVINKIRDIAFKEEIQPFIHVLDLAKDGVIKPHVDSVRYCGTTISGISLLSDSVMRLVRVDEKKYQQANSDYRSQPEESDKLYGFHADIFLPRFSLYIMKNSARYNFTHEILANDKSIFNGVNVLKDRRISIICRNEPR